ncbi:MAG TPA: cupredoxin domain-containing protein [Gemmatimonadales bacterium]|nr:cupredoxin domain-containing protein [Gemmatimonadales bacterium]
MSLNEWLVVAGGVAAIAWVNWYFLLAGRRLGAVAADAGGSREVRITVDGGYEPATIRVPAGQPVRLLFDRRDTSSCSEEIVFPDFGIRRFLPTGKTTPIDITPSKPGKYEFMCGMSMLHGTVIAEPPAASGHSAI